ncbi:MAG: hypothetical protein R3C20_05950 [Planctomycetaceae bacterium]
MSNLSLEVTKGRMRFDWLLRCVLAGFVAVMAAKSLSASVASASTSEESAIADAKVLNALSQLEEFYNLQLDSSSAAKTTEDFTDQLTQIVRPLSPSVKRDKHVSLLIAVIKADRGIDVVREIRAITNRDPEFWPAWRSYVTASLLFDSQKQAMTALQNYHKKVLKIFVEREANSENQDLVREIFWIRDACHQMEDLEDASELWVESIVKSEEAERMLAQLANVEAFKQQLAAEREKKNEQLAEQNKDPEQAKRAIELIVGRVDANMMSLRQAYDAANARLPSIRSAYDSARSAHATAVSQQVSASRQGNASQLAAAMASKGAVAQAENQMRAAANAYSRQQSVMKTAVIRMSGAAQAARDQLTAAKEQYAEALAKDRGAQAAMADAERKVASHASRVPKLPETWIDKGATAMEVAASLQISIEDIFEAARGVTEDDESVEDQSATIE